MVLNCFQTTLGIIFDSKLQWGPQISNTLTKANTALNAIRLIRNYLNSNELKVMPHKFRNHYDDKVTKYDAGH